MVAGDDAVDDGADGAPPRASAAAGRGARGRPRARRPTAGATASRAFMKPPREITVDECSREPDARWETRGVAWDLAPLPSRRRHRRAGTLMPRVVTAAACGAAQSGIVRARSSGGVMSCQRQQRRNLAPNSVATGRYSRTLDRPSRVPFLENSACPTSNSPDNAFSPRATTTHPTSLPWPRRSERP